MLPIMARSQPSPFDVAGLFDQYAAELRQYCASRIGPTIADDIVAQTFLIVYERRHRLESRPPRAWLYGIATNLLRRHRRTEVRGLRALARTGHDPYTLDIADSAVARVDATALNRRLATVLAALPARQRDVLLLYAVAELDYAEIAASLDIPPGSVRSALHRARAKVRAAIGDQIPGVEPVAGWAQ
ncbi:RNA polymerase sigma factor [Dactylosporangium sp. NPDC048998]|uniref:RNA polymerase sigma factor n=1 Tax=Dactylosporangium sp. NPDC048998 TaxID=3363976 RepID=UPI00371DBEFE